MPLGHGSGRRVRFCLTDRFLALFFPVNLLLLFLFFYLRSELRAPVVVGNYAYITLANNEGYAKGAVALAMSLLEAGSLYPLLVLVTKEVPQSTINALEIIGCMVYETELINLPPELSLQTARWGPAFTKFLAWKQIEYSKLIFMDSDLLVLKNVDGLFDASNTLLATVDADASSCNFQPERLELINSGVLVLTPSLHMFTRLILTLHNKTFLARGVINDQDVVVNTMPWEGLPYPTYGAQVTHCECSDVRLWDLENTKIIHFTAGLRKLPKPWDYSPRSHKHTVPTCVVPLYDLWNELYSKALRLGINVQHEFM